MKQIALAVLTLALAGAIAGVRAAEIVRPPDPGQFDTGTRKAVAELRRIVEMRDLPSFEQHLAADATISFGGDHGPAGLDNVWSPQNADTRLWSELAAILAIGGVEARDAAKLEWRAPYPSFVEISDQSLSGYDYVVVLGSRVALRATPDTSAQILARVDHAVLRTRCADTSRWTCVDWNGEPAYVRSDLVRSPVGQRIIIAIDGDRWTITSFVGGD